MNIKMLFSSKARALTIAFTPLIALFLSGCTLENKASTDIDTDDIHLALSVVATSQSNQALITATASRKQTLSSQVELTGGEYFSVQHQDQNTRLIAQEKETLSYQATLNISSNPTDFTLVFHRADGSQISNNISLPDSFSVSSPMPGNSFYEGTPVLLAWNSTSFENQLSVTNEMSCFATTKYHKEQEETLKQTWQIPDNGSYLLPLSLMASDFRDTFNQTESKLNANTACEFNLVLSRSVTHSIANNFAAGSTISATRTITINDLYFYMHSN